jgi:hypothetical protein
MPQGSVDGVFSGSRNGCGQFPDEGRILEDRSKPFDRLNPETQAIVRHLQDSGVNVTISLSFPTTERNSPLVSVFLTENDLTCRVVRGLRRLHDRHVRLSLTVESEMHRSKDLQFLRKLERTESLRIVGRQFDTQFLSFVAKWRRLDSVTLEFLEVGGGDLLAMRHLQNLGTISFYAVNLDRSSLEALTEIKFGGVMRLEATAMTPDARAFINSTDLSFDIDLRE